MKKYFSFQVSGFKFLFILFTFQVSGFRFADAGWMMAERQSTTPEEWMARSTAASGVSAGDADSAADSDGDAEADGVASSQTEITSEIRAMARALNNDPATIFDFVRNEIEYMPVFGLRQSPTTTLLARKGTDADQAALLIALLKAADSSIEANFVEATLEYSEEDLALLFGVDENQVTNCLDYFSIPEVADSGYVLVLRHLVGATIDGEYFWFDPAYKVYDEEGGIDLSSAMNYVQTQVVAAAMSGASESSTPGLTAVDEDGLRAELDSCATNLAAYLRANHPNDDVLYVVGGRSIERQEMDELDTVLPYATDILSYDEYTNLPSSESITMRIQYQGVDETFYGYEIAGKRVSIFHTGASGAPELRVDSDLIATGSATTTGATYSLTITVEPPNYWAHTGTFSVVGGYSYVVLSDFDTASPGLLDYHTKQLTRDRAGGASDTSEKVLGGTLNMIGESYMLNFHRMNALMGSAADVAWNHYYSVGLIAQETGYYIDLKLNLYGMWHAEGDTDKSRAWFRTEALLGSALEHGILEQAQDADNPGISTVKILQLDNEAEHTVYIASSTNWSTVEGRLRNYSTNDVDTMADYIAQGMQLIIPKYGNVSIETNGWTGAGYIVFSTNTLGMLISGGYNGGYANQEGDANPDRVADYVINNTVNQSLPTYQRPVYGQDPVDLISGSFIVQNDDLQLGGAEPRGLTLTRSYHGGQNFINNGMGFGWTHSQDIRLFRHSDNSPALGLRQPLDAVSLLVYGVVAQDLLENQSALRGWAFGALAAKWAMDELTDNAVTVQMGNRSMEFIELPDGQFSPPPNTTAALSLRSAISYGYANTIALSGDYDGDGETDIGVYDPSLDKFYIAQSTDGQLEQSYGFGSTYPAPGDYDGDGQTDIAVIDPSTWKWYINKSSTSLTITQQFGYAGVTNIQADYDGDGDTEIAVYHPTIYTWYIGGYTTTTFGAAGYKAVPADYDGDGKADLASINTNTWTWYIQYSSSGSVRTQQFGFSGVEAVPADYDGDGKADISVFSSTLRQFYVLPSGSGLQYTIRTVTNGSYRVTGDFDGDGDDELAIYSPSAGSWHILGQNDGTYKLTERFGTVIGFDADHCISTWQNADGQTTRYYYDTYTNLILAADAYGRGLTFTYTGNTQLTSVADSSGRSVSYTYSSGNLSTYSDPESKTWTYTYDTNHWIVSMKDPLNQITVSNIYDAIGCVATQINGSGHVYDFHIAKSYRAVEQNQQTNQTIYTFDDDGRQLSKSDALGNTSYSLYDGQGHLIYQIDPRANLTIYEYDAYHNPTNLSRFSILAEPEFVSWSYEYDSNHRLIRETDPLFNITSYGYDTEHHLTAETNALGYVTNYDYTDDGLVEQMDNGQQTTDYSYDNYGTPSTITRTDGGTETLVYNARGDLTSRTDPNTNTTSFTYDKRRLVTSETDALGYSSSNIYDSAGNVVTNIDRNGNILVTRYTPTYKVSSVQYPDGSVVSNSFDARDYLISVTDGRGSVTSNEYDDAGRLISSTDPLGHTTTFSYDEIGNIITTTDALGNITSNQYDSLNRIVSVIDPEGNVTSNEYDDASRLTATIDAAGKRTEYEYDALGRRTRIIRPDGQDEEFEYDALGNLIMFVNAKDNRWTFGYDGMSREVSETNALGHVTSYSYDNAGNLLFKMNANGTTIAYSYDARNLLTNKNYSGENCVYFYDKNRNLTNLISITGTNSFRFDGLNRLVSATDPQGNTTSNTFDLAGNRTGLKYPGSLQLSIAFDSANRLTNLTDWTSRSTRFGFDGADRLTDINYANSADATFEFDGNDRLIAFNYSGSSNFIERSITRNLLGFKTVENISAGLEPIPPSGKQFRHYNDGDQLTHNSANDYAPDLYADINFSYDSNGNITSVVTVATGTTIFVAYYYYDAENRLTSLSSTTSVVSFGYDGLGYRTQKVEDGVTNYFVIDYADDLKRPLVETDASGNALRYFVWADLQLISVIESNGTAYYVHSDELGNVLAMTDTNGNVVAQFSYTPFGQNAGTSGSIDMPFTFMGNYGVWNLGDDQYLTRYRYYNAEWQRFGSVDPQGLQGGYNLFAYANNNPVYWVDFLGLESWYTKALNKTQSALDYAGIFHPAADVVNAGISLFRGDVKGAVLSGISIASVVPSAALKGGVKTFRHYGYAEDASKFADGLKKGGFATHAQGRPMKGTTAQQKLALPHQSPPDSYYKIKVDTDVSIKGPSPVQQTEIPPRPGGGVEYYFPEGTPPGSVEGPFPLLE